MPYAFVQDVPATEPMYRQVRARLGQEPPKGLIAHVVMKHERGLRYIDVWDSEADWERFRDERLERAVSEVLAERGIPHDHSLVRFEGIDVIDTWLGESPTPA
ncbi:MAG: hypothetical protein M3179_01335 [Actinomycetota bacterium]|nr:hypothetical protein [Actinomycetota bacterium]